MVKLATINQIVDGSEVKRALALFEDQHDARRPLDTTSWRLVARVYQNKPLVAQSDLRFQLFRFPNFTYLRNSPDIFLQLALLCMRQPQTIYGIYQLFPKQDKQLINLFITCAILSGMANVIPNTQPNQTAVVQQVPPAADKPSQSRGFFKALLSKLF